MLSKKVNHLSYAKRQLFCIIPKPIYQIYRCGKLLAKAKLRNNHNLLSLNQFELCKRIHKYVLLLYQPTTIDLLVFIRLMNTTLTILFIRYTSLKQCLTCKSSRILLKTMLCNLYNCHNLNCCLKGYNHAQTTMYLNIETIVVRWF